MQLHFSEHISCLLCFSFKVKSILLRSSVAVFVEVCSFHETEVLTDGFALVAS